MKKKDQARYIALNVLIKVNKEGKYSNISLKEALKNRDLSNRDKAFVTQLVYGCLEKQIAIDHIISKFASLKRTNPWIVNILRLSCYQILYLDRVPDSAAVNEAVNLCKTIGLYKLQGFVNGVLRNIVRNKDKILSKDFLSKDRLEGPGHSLSLTYSYPKWLAEKWMLDYGQEIAEMIMKGPDTENFVSIRVNKVLTDIDKVKNKLLEEGALVSKGFYLDEALRVKYTKDIEEDSLYKKGHITVQGEASMLVSHLLAPLPGESVLDACSSPGGKATHICELMDNKGSINAWDIHEHRVELIERNASRMRTKILNPKLHDARVFDKKLKEKMDRVLLDVPCSGLGIVNSKPDIKLRVTPEEINSLVKLQASILSTCSRYVKAGGVLVYSTCTINPDENQKMIKNFLKNNKEFYLDDPRPYLPSALNLAIQDDMIQTIPYRDKIDGFFIARMRKRL